jgi:hypothetical protein
MKNFNILKMFNTVFTVLNYLIYLFLIVGLLLALFDQDMDKALNYKWWTLFLTLEIWFNAVIVRKKEIN